MKKAVIFDYDDTLVTTVKTKWAQLKRCAKDHYDIDLADETLRSVWGQDIKIVINTCFDGREDYEVMIEKYRAYEHDFVMDFHEGVEDMLAQVFASEHYEVGILTASSRKLVLPQLKLLNVDVEQFIFIQTAEDTGVHKPDPMVFEPSLEKLAEAGITNLETIYVGDAIRDFKAADGAGIRFIGVTHGLTSAKEFEAVGAEYVTEMDDLIKSLEL